MLPGTVRHSDSEKERCGPGTKDKQNLWNNLEKREK